MLAMKPSIRALRTVFPITILLWLALPAAGEGPTPTQTETDEYTRYELLEPETASFAIHYEVTATAAGANVYFNPIRKGSVASNESVQDVMTGEPLKFEIVSGEEAMKDPLMKGEEADVDYIKIHLARPVPPDGQARLLILKTYKDAKSYYREGDTIVFNRPLSIPRNKVVLPSGYQLVACNVPSQVLLEPDGRISVSFVNSSGAEAPLIVRAKPGVKTAPAKKATIPMEKSGPTPDSRPETRLLDERAHRSDESVLFLKEPETHAYRISRDVDLQSGTSIAFGTAAGNTDASAYILDTGEKLGVRVMTAGEMVTVRKQFKNAAGRAEYALVVSAPASKTSSNVRIRVAETVTEPKVLRLEGDELVLDRELTESRNAVVLPEGWYLTTSSVPATVTQMPDGRIRLDVWNGGPAPMEALIKARRQVSTPSRGDSR